ncbi:argonaut-like protein, putative [Leishmania donovani]|uniref:Argonaut-like protein, putative n=1 Tax=Leishmania donovani TaxID=5661 RepID=A0A3Q8IKY1_LEIDO|nr:argonaut-like protein, putative [Leishmania donovani]AYU78508.1 argonaut-like protein, putative [Leishmania donovani]TPP49280.1 Piwi domain family protein [Leishmania donovani]CBZ33858.1 argonaut-like protein, putative [Leishmania donovani]
MWSLLRPSPAVASSILAAVAAKGDCRYPVGGIARGTIVINVCLRHYHGYSDGQRTPHGQRSASSALATDGRGRRDHGPTRSPSAPPQQHRSQDVQLQQYRGQQRRSTSLAAAEAASTDLVTARSTFWSQPVKHVSAATLKRQHTLERAQDKKSKFLVRSSIREDGVISNLFPLNFRVADASHPDSHRGAPPTGTHVYIYEMYVTRLTATQRGGSAARGSPSVTGAGARGKARAGAAATAAAIGGVQAGGLASVERRVSPGRAWRAVERFLRHKYAGVAAALLPPLVQLNSKVYTAAPLPPDALVLPRAYFDIGWQTAVLRLQRRCRFTELPPSELQMLLNKIVPEVARTSHREQRQKVDATPSFLEVVREKTGKLVCATQGVSAGGLRIYQGVLVQAIFVDSSAALDPNAADAREGQVARETHTCSLAPAKTGAGSSTKPPTDADACPIATRHLGDTPVGLTDAAAAVHFQVVAFLRPFAYRGTHAESYRIRDASGVYLASLWAPAKPRSLTVGAVYAAAPVRIREFAERGNARLIEFLDGTTLTLLSASTATAPASLSSGSAMAQPFTPRSDSGNGGATSEASRLPGQLSLKIDTKGTIASEVSLWEEVLQHFGHGPYDEAAQQRLRKSVQGIPVVISYSLRQSIVCDVRFDSDALLAAASHTHDLAAAEEGRGQSVSAPHSSSPNGDAVAHGRARERLSAPMLCVREPRLAPLMPRLDSQQPCAILADHTIVPLQVLHCCFDPRMRSWQEIGVSALSLMPQQRAALLESIRALLANGLQRWGIDVSANPYRTKALSLLPAPMKCVVPQRRPATGFANPAVVAFPTTIVVIGVTGPRCTAEQSRRISLTAQHLAHYFRTKFVATLADEGAAVQYVHEQLMYTPAAVAAPTGQPTASLKDPNTSVILITNEIDTRATRWLKVECMCRGAHFIAIPASSSPKKLNLAGAQLRMRIASQFELNPLRGVDLRGELPVLGHRHVLVIGVDSCHTNTHSVGTIVGILSTPTESKLLSYFWRHDARGRETQHVAKHFRGILAGAVALSGRVDEVVVFQDGDVFSELVGVKEELTMQVPNCGLTFMCLHKRCNVRFMHASPGQDGSSATRSQASAVASASDDVEKADRDTNAFREDNGLHNLVKGVVIPALAPVPLDHQLAANSFYLQAHESSMSTARIVQYTVHHVSPSLDVTDVQQIANIMANVLAPQATKLPMSTRCAHRLADQAERLLDAVPQLTADMIPRPLCNRLWFL